MVNEMIYSVTVEGAFETNCYFFIDRDGHGFVIDPGAQGEQLVNLIHEQEWTIEAILLTHGLFDHIGGVDVIRQALAIPVKIHENGAQVLVDPVINLSGVWGTPFTVEGAEYFKDGDVLKLNGKPALRVIHTPGHTVDSAVFYSEAEKTAFVGDTIFKGSYGAYHYPTGDFRTLMQSIRGRILTLPDDTVLLSGHSDGTTVGTERKFY